MSPQLVWCIDYRGLDGLEAGDILLTASQAIHVLGKRSPSMMVYLGEKGAVSRLRLGRGWAYPLSGLRKYMHSKLGLVRMDALPEQPTTVGVVRGYPTDLLSAQDASVLLGVEPTAGRLQQLRRGGLIQGYWLISEHGYSQADIVTLRDNRQNRQ